MNKLASGSDAHPPLSAPKRLFILALGHVSVLVAVIGLLLPVMPASPFIIFASVCYARTSKRFHLMLLNNRYFGTYVRDWHSHHCLQKNAKYTMIAVVTVSFSVTILLFVLINPWRMQTAIVTFSIVVLAAAAVFLLARIPACTHTRSR